MTARIRRAATAVPRGVPALLAALALLLATVAAGGPAASASVRSGCTWQPLNLLQGWQSDQSAYGTGDPVYCVGNGIVYLSGSLAHPGRCSPAGRHKTARTALTGRRPTTSAAISST